MAAVARTRTSPGFASAIRSARPACATSRAPVTNSNRSTEPTVTFVAQTFMSVCLRTAPSPRAESAGTSSPSAGSARRRQGHPRQRRCASDVGGVGWSASLGRPVTSDLPSTPDDVSDSSLRGSLIFCCLYPIQQCVRKPPQQTPTNDIARNETGLWIPKDLVGAAFDFDDECPTQPRAFALVVLRRPVEFELGQVMKRNDHSFQ